MYDQEYLAKFAMDTVPFWKNLENEAGFNTGTILIQNGFLFFGEQGTGKTTEGELGNIIKTCDKLKMDCEKLSEKDIIERFPFSNLKSGIIGVYRNESGYINVDKAIQALITVCKKTMSY